MVSSNELLTVFRTLPSLSVLMRPDLVVLEASDAYVQATQATREQLIGYPFVNPKQNDPAWGFTTVPVKNAEGDVLYVIYHLQDVTAYSKMEKRHTEAEQRTHVIDSLLSATADFNYTFNRQGRFSYVNRALLNLLGLTKEQALGKNFHDLKYPPELAAKLQAQIEEVFITGKQLKDETPYTNYEGRKGYYEYIFVPIFDAAGHVEAVAGSTRDFSALKASEERFKLSEKRLAEVNHELALDVALIEDLNRNLERRVIERTIELEKASQRIQLALEEKVVLIKEVHHRVKNNLQIVTSLLRLQSNEMTDPVALAILKQSQDRIHSMALVHELLYRSKNMSHINFREYVDILIRNLFKSQKPADQAIDFAVDVDEIHIDIDTAIPCGLIITELVINALKYAFPNNKMGTVSVSFKTNEGNTFTLTVQDNGIGLPPNLDWKNLTSLGFQIVNALCPQLRGTIHQSETPGGGTSFNLTFPRNRADKIPLKQTLNT